jgi:hypothetical protein
VEYRLNGGQYVLHTKSPMRGDLVPTGQPLDKVALAIDIAEGTLHKHGIPEKVSAWQAETSQRLRAAGCTEWADNLVTVTGRFPLEEVNNCLAIQGYAGAFYARLIAGDVEALPWDVQEASAAGGGYSEHPRG